MTSNLVCGICPRECKLKPLETGFCGARINKDGVILAKNYGHVTSIALDPIEKKPLKLYKAGSKILSIGSYGCNLRCSFCQNYRISMAEESPDFIEMLPETIVNRAKEYKKYGNIGIAYTYNEPLVGYEFVRDCAVQIKKAGLDNIVVTNGYVNEEALIKLLPSIDAFNIDLKAFNEKFYKNIGGDLGTVKNSIEIASKKNHVEVTCLIIQGENDSEEEMHGMAKWLSSLDKNIPLHISKFYPAYEMSYKKATQSSIVKKLAVIANQYLNYVFLGNL